MKKELWTNPDGSTVTIWRGEDARIGKYAIIGEDARIGEAAPAQQAEES